MNKSKTCLQLLAWLAALKYSVIVMLLGASAHFSENWTGRTWYHMLVVISTAVAFLCSSLSVVFMAEIIFQDRYDRLKNMATAWLSGVDSCGVIGKVLIYGFHWSIAILPFYQFWFSQFGYWQPTYFYKWAYVLGVPLWLISMSWVALKTMHWLVRQGQRQRGVA